MEGYHRLDEFNERDHRTELIQEIVIEKKSQSPLRTAVAIRLYDFIRAKRPAGLIVRRDDPVALPDSEPDPGHDQR